MNTYMYIGPRECGKTEMALNLFTASREGSVKFITTSTETIRIRGYLYNIGGGHKPRHILTHKSLPGNKAWTRFLDSCSYPAIIIDNFFDFDLSYREEIYKLMHSLNRPFDLHVFATPKRLYDVQLINDIMEIKTSHTLIKTIASSTSSNIKDVFYNFLSDPEVDIINLRRPILKEEITKYKQDPEQLLTQAVGLYERERF